MRHLLRGSLAIIAVFVVATSAAGASKVSTVKTSSGRLDTGFIYVPWGSPELDATQFERMHAAGAKFVRINALWSSIAPSGTTIPANFHPTDPADPLYNWLENDAIVRAATKAGLQPILALLQAPVWAQGNASTRPTDPGGYKPNAAQFAAFSTAAATRYSGSFEDLPPVRYWAIWNEANLRRYLYPQMAGKTYVGALSYRALLNAGAAAIHRVSAGNVVIAGETSPFGGPASDRVRPLTFMEKVLCVSEKQVRKVWKYKSACKAHVEFDVWSQHPYTEGGPSAKAYRHGDVPLGNMSDMLSVLNTAIRSNHVVARRGVRLWVTEFSWDSNPPDPKGVPAALEARWVSEALYRQWSTGVTFFAWFLVRDLPLKAVSDLTPGSFYQSGLYTINKSKPGDVSLDKAKPALTAFRFPFVAFPRSTTSITVWGRTPNSATNTVVIQRKSGSAWKLVKKLRANRYGIFRARIAKPAKTAILRARLANGSMTSVPFSLIAPKKSWRGCAFGAGCHLNTPK